MRLLRLYPRAWRERYRQEMLALLEQHDVTLSTWLDLLRGACDAWTEQRRYVMPPLLAAAWRGTRFGLVPGVFPLAWFLLRLDLNADTTLLNNLAFLAPPSLATLVLMCLCAGKRQAERDRALGGRLVAGAAAGIVGVGASMVMVQGLILADLGFGISSHIIALQGGSVSYGSTVASVAAVLVRPSSLLHDAVVLVAGGALGASIAALGTTLRGLRITREVRPA